MINFYKKYSLKWSDELGLSAGLTGCSVIFLTFLEKGVCKLVAAGTPEKLAAPNISLSGEFTEAALDARKKNTPLKLQTKALCSGCSECMIYPFEYKGVSYQLCACSGESIGKSAEKGLKLIEEWLKRDIEREISDPTSTAPIEIENVDALVKSAAWTYDPKTKLYTGSDSFYEIFGVEKKPLPREKLFSYIHPEDREKAVSKIDSGIRDGTVHQSFFYRLIAGDGSIKYVNVNSINVFDENGRFLRRFGAIQDVTEQKLEIERLRQRERRLEKAHKLSLTGYWSYDIKTDEMVWSEQLYSILEVDKSIKPSHNFFVNLIHPEDQNQYTRLFEKALNSGGLDSFDCSFRILLKDGRIKWLEGFTEVVRNEQDEAIFLNGYLRDVSSLKLQREVFDTSSSVGDVGVFDLNLITGRLKANEQWFVNNGLEYSSEEQDISIILDKLHPEDRRKINAILADCAAGKTKQFSADLRVYISSERYKWTRASAQVKDYLPANNIIRLVGVVLDINEIKKAESSSRINENKFKSMFDNAPLPYQSLDPEGRFIEVNPAWLGHLGYSKQDVVGRWFGDFLSEEYKDAFKENFQEFQACGEIDNVIFEMIKADGSVITVSFQGRFSYDSDSNPVKSHCVFRDITEELESMKTIRLLSKFPSENPNPVLRMSEIGELYYTNKAGEEFLEGSGKERKLNKDFKDQVLIECCINSPGVFNYKLGEKTYRVSFAKIPPENYINIYASDISEEVDARKRIDELSKFPEENPSPVLRIDFDKNVLYSNEAAKRFTKFEGSREVIKDELLKKTNEISTNTETGGFETEYNEQTYSFRYSVIDPPGYINLYGTDITGRKKAELEKQQQAENLRITVNSIGDAVIAADTQARVTLMNPNAEQLSGVKSEDALGRRVSEVLDFKRAGTEEQVANPVDRVLETGEEVGLANDTVLVSADGSRRQIADNGAPIKDAEGNITGAVLVFRDVTEQYENRKRIDESERELKRAQEIGEIGSWKFNLNTSEVFASPETCRLYGLDPAKSYSIPEVQEVPLKKHRKQLNEAIEKLLTGEKKYDEEFKIKRPSDGKIRWIHSIAEYDKEANVIRGTIQDITKSKEASEKLAENEAKLRSYIDNAPFGVFVADSKGRYLEVNPCASRMSGYSNEELTKMSIPDLLTPESKKLGEEHFKQLCQMGFSYGETEHFHKNGERRWWSVSAVKLSEDRFLGFTEDITEKKKALLQLEESEENLRITLDSIGDAVISTDTEGRIVLFNPVAQRLTGFSLQEAAGRDIFEVFNIFKGGTNEPAENPVKKVLEKGEIVGLANHTVLISKDGSEYQIADSGAPIRNSKDEMIGVVLVFRDVTKQYEYQRKIRESEERFNAILHTIPDMVSVHDRDLNIVFSNWKGFAAVDKSKRVIGSKCYKTYRGYDDICPDCKAGEVLKTGKQIHREARLPDGNWFDIRVMPISPEGEKEPAYFVEWVRDITERKKNEELIKESEEKFRSLYQSILDVILILDENGFILDCNKAAEENYEYTREELIGKNVTDLCEESDIEDFRSFTEKVFREGSEKRNSGHPHISKSGKKIYHDVNYSLVEYKGEKRIMAVCRDITKRLKAENELRENKTFLDSILESIQDGISVLSKDLDVLYTNPKMEQWYSQNLPLEGKKCYECYHNSKKPCSNCPSIRAMKTGNTEYEIVEGLPGTEMSYVELFSYPMKDPITNEIIGVIEFVRDVTERLKNEHEIEKLTERLQRSTKAGGVGVWEYNIKTGELIWDDSMYEVYGANKKTHPVQKYSDWQDMLHPDDADNAIKAVEDALENHIPFDTAFRIITDNGQVRWIAGKADITYDKDGKPEYMAGTNWDITELKEYQQSLEIAAEQARQANTAKSQFLANMSHEIRTPLNAIIGYGNIVKQSNLDPIVLKHVESMNIAGNSLLALVNDVLDLSRIDAGKFKVTNKPVDIGALMNELEAIFENRMKSKGLKFNISKELAVNGILIDGARLRQILVNLLGNAAKFTEEGHIDLKAGVYHSSGKSDLYDLEFTVSDTGPGIKKEDQEKIFESFEQVDAGPTKKHQGSGLGLSISAKLSELLGGELSVESETGKGSTFRLHLPKRKFAEIEAYDSHSESVVFSPCKVVVVEDDEDNLKVLCELLKTLNLKPVPFESGSGAVEYFKNSSGQVVLCDLRMPEMAGDEAVREIKKTRFGSSASFIAVTADIFEKQHYDMSVFDDVLHKPVSKADLVGVLEKYLDHTFSQNASNTISKGAGKKLNKNIKLSKKAAEKYKQQISPMIEEASSAGLAMKPIAELAGSLRIFAEENKNQQLKALAEELDFAARSFDINLIDECISILKELGR
ncbi:PAS domain S-box protein [Sedimentisphaera salicampi]|uniref:histidine kinase n=1 Tax=Sedimentisphaera salicampi TaxID=1941349 RepID=A0A1W6LK71_9BACT|nr:PAS domain S-box protein [Sedimentisphaera salicampi]ARN56200.1 Aerobic respiration control sensor protein ArcB [Sedimentisphaera salicampi]